MDSANSINVHIAITGIQTDCDNARDTVTSDCEGVLKEQNGKSFVYYFENADGTEEKIRNLIAIENGRITVTKSGAVVAKMIYETGSTKHVDYKTAYGIIGMDIYTKNVMVIRDKNEMNITIDYDLKSQGELINSTVLKIRITM